VPTLSVSDLTLCQQSRAANYTTIDDAYPHYSTVSIRTLKCRQQPMKR